MTRRTVGMVLGIAALVAASPALAQLVGGGLLPPAPSVGLPSVRDLPTRDLTEGLPSRLPRAADPAEGALAQVRGAGEAALVDLRRLSVERLLTDHPRFVEADDQGAPVVRGEILALAPSAEALERARQAGFRIARRSNLEGLGIESVVLAAPREMTAREAVRRLRVLDPEGQYDFNHLFQASGVAAGAAKAVRGTGGPARGVKVGLVDGSAAASHPALRGTKVTQKAFGPGGARVTDHATAVASLLVGSAGPFRGAAPGATLLVADVYGPTPAGGSAEAIARGLSWLAENQAQVINISLVGPQNRLLGAAVGALTSRGHVVVAAVGNDGPAAPPLYPAAYPGVVAVTGVNAQGRVLPEAGRGAHVDFAAPGADMAAAGAGGGYLSVRGTSFAAPLVAGLLARESAQALASAAVDLGAPGPDPIYGKGLVAAGLRVEPRRVGARSLALRGP